MTNCNEVTGDIVKYGDHEFSVRMKFAEDPRKGDKERGMRGWRFVQIHNIRSKKLAIDFAVAEIGMFCYFGIPETISIDYFIQNKEFDLVHKGNIIDTNQYRRWCE